ncbi:MAG TPA: family 1 glycosylhydrolase [Patescibacteria group bacterium]|nr:family 1 glycosylhydrolase [Patescibacteria group bacterium]
MDYRFPKNFYWGCASSSHQIEGNTYNDWSEWEKSEERISELKRQNKDPREYISGSAANSFILNNQDIACLKELNVNAYRFSIEWSRIEPEQGSFDYEALKNYQNFILKLKANNIEPFVTLWHWPIPVWARDLGGWQSKKILPFFDRYVKIVAEFLDKNVDYWVTLNEPTVYASNSYLTGQWPPQKKSLFLSLKVIKNLIRAHKSVYAVLKKVDANNQIGIASHNIHFDPAGKKVFNKVIAGLANYFWNEYFLNKISKEQDFVGLNYYFHNLINYGFGKNKNKIVSDMGWELYPEGIGNVIKGLDKYKKPIYILEHGLADKDDKHRAWYLKESLKSIHKAIASGSDVRGYFHWSLLDNFEWADGFFPRFGLYEVNYKTFERIPRPTVKVYSEICRENSFNNDN